MFGDRRMPVKGQQTLYELCRQWIYNNPNPTLIRTSNIDGALKECSGGEGTTSSAQNPPSLPREIADLKFLEDECLRLEDHVARWKEDEKLKKQGAKNKRMTDAQVLHNLSMQLRNTQSVPQP
jgi:hypothetical protein